MDLASMRKQLVADQAVYDRIAADLAAVKEKLSLVSVLARDAQALSREKAADAVITRTDEAKAEAAKAKEMLTAAFDEETTLKDQVPALDAAMTRLLPGLIKLRDAIAREEKALVLAAVGAMKPKALEQLREAAAQLLVVHWRGDPANSGQIELGNFLEDMAGIMTVFNRAEEIRRHLRAQVIEEVSP